MSKTVKLKDLPNLPYFDLNNISGKQLAEVGRWALEGKKIVEGMKSEIPEVTSIEWLDMRIQEVCDKGRL